MTQESPLGTATFQLGILGGMIFEAYGARLETIGLKVKHVAVLTALAEFGPTAQQDLARTVRVAPSLVVLYADQLEHLDAVQRVRDAGDRRRQLLSLTPAGKHLLAKAATLAREVDAEFLGALRPEEVQGLDAALRTLSAKHLTVPR
ncbi:MarR family winged helix-turn-helix transcriptional regulator [Hamadaea tsunoensis]|uniref:MarR family winged helix-turn-helix transcriptional regulator n=1 Tax=Hamadaea tsunoensis TaxID=53368 RepID=UPI00040E4744|nr:MarR family transcriptional regulator [Hamadaea tsunoensis]